MLALHHVLRAAGTDSSRRSPTPFVVAPHYRELPGLDLLTPPDRFPRRARRHGHVRLRLARPARRPRSRRQGGAELDRHRPPHLERPVRHDQRDRPDAAASGVLVRRSFALGPPSEPTPRCACTPRSSATPDGSSTTPRRPAVFELARELVQFDLPIARLCRTLFEEHRFAYLQLLGEVLADAGARAREALRVDRSHPGRSRSATASRSRRSKASSTSCAAPRGRGRVRAQGRGRRHVAGQPPFARRRRRPRIAEAQAAAATASPPASVERRPSTTVVAASATRLRALTVACHDGLVVVDKPAGWTSHDVVGKLRKVYGQRRSGTRARSIPTRPACCSSASGAPPGCCASSRRPARRTAARIVFGVATDTLDAPGDGARAAPMPIDPRAGRGGRAGFVGEIEQVPPMVSAVKVGGRGSTSWPAQGEEVEPPPRRAGSTGSTSRSSSPARTRGAPSSSSAPAAPTSARSRPISASRSAAARTSPSCAGCASVRSARRGASARRDRSRPATLRAAPARRCATSSRSSSTTSRRAPSRTARRSRHGLVRPGATARARSRWSIDTDGDAARGVRTTRRRREAGRRARGSERIR